MVQMSPPPIFSDRRDFLAPLAALAEDCPRFTGAVAGSFHEGGRQYPLPRFCWSGEPRGGFPPIRLGLFALVHGDEPAGALALVRLLEFLAQDPAPAAGYELVIYPVCNPTGLEDGTRENRRGRDLNREFWRESTEPEVRILEAELRRQNFDGIIALHADDTSDGLYGYAHGRVINENLLVPALHASERVLPRNCGPVIDGFSARNGIIGDCFQGVLAPPPDQKPRPFEIIFETPARAALEQQAEAAQVALLTILGEYRGFIAHAANL
jgi:hypothetical protein